jgi:hypothetical protein
LGRLIQSSICSFKASSAVWCIYYCIKLKNKKTKLVKLNIMNSIILTLPNGKVLYLNPSGPPEEEVFAPPPSPPLLVEVHHSHDTFTNPTYSPDNWAVQSGNWTSLSTWRHGVPTADQNVVVEDYNVLQNGVDAHVDTLYMMGTAKLTTSPTTSTTLTFGTMIFDDTSEWHVHGNTEGDPLGTSVIAQFIRRDTPLPGPEINPLQHLGGIYCLDHSRAILRGASKTCLASDLRLTVAPMVGHTTLTFENPPTGWLVGDKVVIPPTGPYIYGDSTGRIYSWNYLFDESTIASIAGNVVTLTSPLVRNHPSATSVAGINPPAWTRGLAPIYPHAINITRNIKIRSANPNGTRGHTLYGERCDHLVHFVEHTSLGRTRGSSPFGDGTTSSHHVNQKGRYACHMHHNYGPDTGAVSGYQGEVYGCSFYDSRKWPIAIHGSSYKRIEGNNIYWFEHSGISLEDGNECYNDIDDNAIFGSYAGLNLSPTSETGTDANTSDVWPVSNGIWLLQPNGNNIRRNIIAGGRGSAYMPHGIHLDGLGRGGAHGNLVGGNHALALRRGADVMHGVVGVDFEWKKARYTIFGEYSDNEHYSLTKGPSFDHYDGGGSNLLVVSNTTCWNMGSESFFAYGGFTPILVDGLTSWGAMTYGQSIDAMSAAVTMQNVDLRPSLNSPYGSLVGFMHQGGIGYKQDILIKDSYICAKVGVKATFPAIGSNSYSFRAYERTVTLDNVLIENPPGQAVPKLIELLGVSASAIPPARTQICVETFQNTEGNDFRMFYNEQLPGSILKATSEINVDPTRKFGGVEVGQTNEQALLEYGRCVGDELIPTGATGPNPVGYPGAHIISYSDLINAVGGNFSDVLTHYGTPPDWRSARATLTTLGRDLIILSISSTRTTEPDVILEDSEGNTWTPLTKYAAGGKSVQLLYCLNPNTSARHQFILKNPTAIAYTVTDPAIGVIAVKGAHASPLVSHTGTASSSSATSISPGSITPPVDGCLIVTACVAGTLSSGLSVSTGFSPRLTDGIDSVVLCGGIAYHVQSSAAAINPTWSWTTASSYAVAMAVFKPI